MVIRRKVKQILDGGTFTVNRKIGGTNVVRLAGLNAPFAGKEAVNRLKRLIDGKTVIIVPVKVVANDKGKRRR